MPKGGTSLLGISQLYSWKKTLSLEYIMLQLFCGCNIDTHNISTFWSMCSVPSTTAFWTSLMMCFPGMLIRYFVNDSETVTVPSVIMGITYVFAVHTCCISAGLCILKSFWFLSWSHLYLLKFQHILKVMFRFHHHRLRCTVHFYTCFCQFSLFNAQYG